MAANVALAPVAGPLGRVVLGGRDSEGFSNDREMQSVREQVLTYI